jgi:hypothetical protein
MAHVNSRLTADQYLSVMTAQLELRLQDVRGAAPASLQPLQAGLALAWRRFTAEVRGSR